MRRWVMWPHIEHYRVCESVLGLGRHREPTAPQLPASTVHRGKWSLHRHTQMGARPPINFLGAINYTLRTW